MIDPKALAKYVLALIVKKDQSEKEIRKLCSEQLEVFLQRDTERFIDKLFYSIKYKDYLKVSIGVLKLGFNCYSGAKQGIV